MLHALGFRVRVCLEVLDNDKVRGWWSRLEGIRENGMALAGGRRRGRGEVKREVGDSGGRRFAEKGGGGCGR